MVLRSVQYRTVVSTILTARLRTVLVLILRALFARGSGCRDGDGVQPVPSLAAGKALAAPCSRLGRYVYGPVVTQLASSGGS